LKLRNPVQGFLFFFIDAENPVCYEMTLVQPIELSTIRHKKLFLAEVHLNPHSTVGAAGVGCFSMTERRAE
jgi:hypothetical protein